MENMVRSLLCDAATSIAPTASQRIGAPDNILVKEGSTPYLAWNEACPKYTNEEPQRKEAPGGSDRTCQRRGNGTEE